ncbi:unnamed protein product [Rhizopus microsporus]
MNKLELLCRLDAYQHWRRFDGREKSKNAAASAQCSIYGELDIKDALYKRKVNGLLQIMEFRKNCKS